MLVILAFLITDNISAIAGINAGDRQAVARNPFVTETIAEFNTPWAIAFLPDGRLLVTEKAGELFLVTGEGHKTEVSNVPAVAFEGQNGLLDIAVSPEFEHDRLIYFTYSEPARDGVNLASSLALAQAILSEDNGSATLADIQILWRQMPKSVGGQPGGIIAFSLDGRHLFLSSGDRMHETPAQDPDQALGKILRFNRDGSVPQDNPQAAAGGVRALTWTMGHRNPYGLAFAPDGKLWSHEMGPRGGDELNLIQAGKNYGWPIVSNGDYYNGTPIPRHDTRPDFEPPVLYWTPVIAPAGLVFYQGELFDEWHGSALIGGLGSMALVRVKFNPDGSADEAERYAMGNRIRDVAVAQDGAVWLVEDDFPGRLLRLTPIKFMYAFSFKGLKMLLIESREAKLHL